ncbi:hypothetical protein [Candidatus Leptofilum sp.]|uniref:hypothetical protein n=1 Tax=Candidatus Leptofilum sp. TaxID=3241576 RepID=UPI003B5CF47F
MKKNRASKFNSQFAQMNPTNQTLSRQIEKLRVVLRRTKASSQTNSLELLISQKLEAAK